MDKFQILTRFYYQLIQFIHHYGVAQKQVENERFWSKAFAKKIEDLNKFVKPAKPNETVKSTINTINTRWALEMNKTLKQHYNHQIDETLKQIRQTQLPENKRTEAKNVAINWAKKRFKKKLTVETLNSFNRATQSPTSNMANRIQNRAQNSDATKPPKQRDSLTQMTSTGQNRGHPNRPYSQNTPPYQATRIRSNSKEIQNQDQNSGPNRLSKNCNSLTQTTPTGQNKGQTNRPHSQNTPPNHTTRIRSNPPNTKANEIPLSNKFAVLESQAMNILGNQTQAEYELNYPTIIQATLATNDKSPTRPKITTPEPGPKSPQNKISVQGINDPLSNFYKTPIEISNAKFASGEQYFQYQKAIHFDRLDIAEQISQTSDPFKAKKLAQDISLPDKTAWYQEARHILTDIFQAKYEQLMEFREALLNSVGKTLEHTVMDPYWGSGLDKKGQNEYGNLLMTFRTQVTGGHIHINIRTQEGSKTPPSSPGQTNTPPEPTLTKNKGQTPKKTRTNNHTPQNRTPTEPGIINSLQNTETIVPTTESSPTNGSQKNPPIKDLKVVLSPIDNVHGKVNIPLRTETCQEMDSPPDLEFETPGETDRTCMTPPPPLNSEPGTNSDGPFNTPSPQNPSPDTNSGNPFFSPQALVTFKISPTMAETHSISPQNWPHPIPSKSVLVIGDSNMRNIRHTPLSDVEIFGYPGANFQKITTLLKKVIPSHIPIHVILALGINHRQLANATIQDSFRKLLNQVTKTYPIAQIYITGTNFSKSLPTGEQDQLNFLNQHTKTYFLKRGKPQGYIEPINDTDYVTVNDNIHVTQKTADKLLAHWLNHLNW